MFIFVSILRLLQFIQYLATPILRHLPPLRSRHGFELKNEHDPLSRRWNNKESLYWAFHCSSEGEFEQIRPLMELCFELQEKIELLYTSPSVERRVQAFAKENIKYIRILRLPLVSSIRLKDWSQASGLIMCRYDFFPDLLLLPVKKRVLVWASLKGKNISIWHKLLYKHFDRIVAATNSQQEIVAKLTTRSKVESYDFRPSQIQSRLQQATLGNELAQELNLSSISERLVLGSVWANDFFLLEDLLKQPGKLHVWLAPHALDDVSLSEISNQWQQLYPQVPLLRFGKDKANLNDDKMAWLIDRPGHLLELYSQFTCAYVGGGFGRSIHSVLEPMMAGCWSACGPRTHRSTEIDLGNELSPGQITVVRDSQEFLAWWNESHERQNALKDDNRARAIHNWQEHAMEVAGRTLAH